MASPLTRRQLLASAAAGGAALSVGPYGGVLAQAAKRIEQFAPKLDNIIVIGEPINQLAEVSGATVGRPKVRCGGKRAATFCSVTSMATDA
jgi:hypothetical protein